MSAFRPLIVAALATLGAGQASVDCSTGVTSVSGGNVAWDAAVTLTDGVRSNNGRDYLFRGVPSFVDGGRYFASGIWPNGTDYSLTVNYDPPAMVFIYVDGDGRHNAGMSAALVADGWDSETIDTFQRVDPTGTLPNKTLHVYSRFFSTGDHVMVGPLTGTLVSGIISTCDWPTTTTTTVTTFTSTETSITTTSTVTTTTISTTSTATSTTRTWTGTTTTLTTVTSTSTTLTTSTTSSTTVTTTTVTTTTTTTTTDHLVVLIEGAMYMIVDRPSELKNQLNRNETVRQAVVDGIASSVPGVEPHLTRVVSATLGIQMPSVGSSNNTGNRGDSSNDGNRRLRGAEPRQLTSVVVVGYQALVPTETVARHGLHEAYFVSNTLRDNLNIHVVEQIQAVTDFVVSQIEVTEPEFTVSWSRELGWYDMLDEKPSSSTASGGWIVMIIVSIVGVCCASYVFTRCLRRIFLHKAGKETEEAYVDENRASEDGDMEVGPEMSDDCKAPSPRCMAPSPRCMATFQGLDQDNGEITI